MGAPSVQKAASKRQDVTIFERPKPASKKVIKEFPKMFEIVILDQTKDPSVRSGNHLKAFDKYKKSGRQIYGNYYDVNNSVSADFPACNEEKIVRTKKGGGEVATYKFQCIFPEYDDLFFYPQQKMRVYITPKFEFSDQVSEIRFNDLDGDSDRDLAVKLKNGGIWVFFNKLCDSKKYRDKRTQCTKPSK